MSCELVIGKYTLESLTNGMYSSPFDMYREYIQNAVDSFDEAIALGIEIPDKLHINISINSEAKTVVIRDNGCGIKTDKAIATLLDIGNSQKRNQTARGFRGIGRLAGLSYCEKLSFKTSYKGEDSCTTIEYNAKLLKDLMYPGTLESISVEDVIDRIVTIRKEKESPTRRYFEVLLEGVWEEAGLTDTERVRDYLIEHAPLYYANSFKWGRTIEEKVRLNGYSIPRYHIFLNQVELHKPYEDTFISDRVKRNLDLIRDVSVEVFFRGETLSAVLWYAKTNFYGTILNNLIKGIRVRQGNILIGDKGTCSSLFKEERFNGWLIGELFILDIDIIANSRRDGFEKNNAYFELLEKLKSWAYSVSKDIRHLSYERSLTSSRKKIAEAEEIDDLSDENNLCFEELDNTENISESAYLDHSESDELAETDYITKLELFIGQKRTQTKYAALNINGNLTMEQRKILERVFDLIKQEFDPEMTDKLVNIISSKF